jgi:PAS domain S-box-containing protein
MVNLNGKIIRFNDAYAALIGYTDEEIRNKDFTVYISEEAYQKEIAAINSLISGSQSDLKFRSSRLTKDQKVVEVEVNAILFRDKHNRPEFVLKRIEDVTDRMRSEEDNRNQLYFFQTMMHEIPLSIYFKDKDSRFIEVSRHLIHELGCASKEEVVGKTDFDFFDLEHAQQAFNDEKEILQSGETLIKEECTPLKDKVERWGQTIKAPLRNLKGEIVGTYGITRDITAIKQAERKVTEANRALSEKNTKLQETLDELKRTQNQLLFSEKMAALGNLIGGIAHEINTPLGAIKASSTNINEVVEKLNVDLPWLINHASTEEINWLFRLVNESDAREVSVFSKEERQKKRELTLLLENEGIANAPVIADTITSLRLNHSHEEILTLLRLPNAQHLLQMLKVLFSLKRNANNIYVSVEKASKVVRALKSYIHKSNTNAKESTNIPETIDTVLILTANLLKISKTEVITHYGNVPLIFCHQDEICQIWTNLITNALQAMNAEEGRLLEISVEQPDEDKVRIAFKDNGCGMPPEVAKHLFEPYFTTKPAGIGTGMGLDISRQIVERHHGSIYFDTVEGQGSTFYVEIPVNQDPGSLASH